MDFMHTVESDIESCAGFRFEYRSGDAVYVGPDGASYVMEVRLDGIDLVRDPTRDRKTVRLPTAHRTRLETALANVISTHGLNETTLRNTLRTFGQKYALRSLVRLADDERLFGVLDEFEPEALLEGWLSEGWVVLSPQMSSVMFRAHLLQHEDEARSYAPNARYRVGDSVVHTKFGYGVVVQTTASRAAVRFSDRTRQLVHT